MSIRETLARLHPGRAPAERRVPDQELILYQFRSCPYCRRVLRVVDDLGLDIELRDTAEVSRWRTDLRERTGRTQVPCLFIDGEPMFESSDIIAWLREHCT